MRLTALVRVALTAGLVSACETAPQPGDTVGPVITVQRIERGLPVVHTSDRTAERQPAPRTCPDGSSPYPGGTPTPNVYYILPADETRTKLLFSFTDPSGIRSASISTGVDPSLNLQPPLPVVNAPRHGGGTADFYQWNWRETATLRRAKLFELELSPRNAQPGTILGISAYDGAGNRARPSLLFVLPEAAACN
jgi:hypothetical protein